MDLSRSLPAAKPPSTRLGDIARRSALPDLDPDRSKHAGRAQTVLALGERYIAEHMTCPGLGASVLVRHLGVSQARLYRAFAVRGGVNAAIRNIRLDRIRDQLSTPAYQSTTIEHLAIQAGFSDYTSFHRSFRFRFGSSPTSFRQRG